MLTLMQLKVSRVRRRLTQEQKAQIVDIEVARKFVQQAIEETLAVKRQVGVGLLAEDLDHIFNNQPVHFDGMGYLPHWFRRPDIKLWAEYIYRQRYRSECERKASRSKSNGMNGMG